MEWQPPASMSWGYRNHQETLKQTIAVLTGGSEKNRGGSMITQTKSIKGIRENNRDTIHWIKQFILSEHLIYTEKK